MSITEYIELYKTNLLQDVIPFWLQNSKDDQYGGFFTCLDEKGNVYDTDKFVWLQCRQVWCFSMLYNKVEKKQEWLDFAKHGTEFLQKNGMDKRGNWYFSLTQEGRPIIQPYNIFSDCFATMAFGQLFKATKIDAYAQIATQTFANILQRKDNPKGQYSKAYPGTRPLKSFALPMILCNLVLEIETLLAPEMVSQTIDFGIQEVTEVFYKSDLGLILEHVAKDGSFSDSFEGRLVNPGHGLESMWFIMDLAERNKDSALMQKAVEITLNILEFGWDNEYGGIFYFLDVKGHPPQQLEWDQKIWWVHVESMVSLLKGYLYTGDERCWKWFERLHQYTWSHFVDSNNGEWYGYLNREGKILLPLKGGKWKGCFHIPRGLYQCYTTLEAIEKKHKQLIS